MSASRVTAAAIQMVSSDDVASNLEQAAELTGEAAKAGARVVVWPENFAFMGRNDAERLRIAEPFSPMAAASSPLQKFAQRMATEHRICLAAGTIPIATPGEKRAHSAMMVYAPDGALLGRYDKIHLFDVDVPDGSGHYRESGSTVPGASPLAVATQFGAIGLSICYDLRFPELFRSLVGDQTAMFALASAFTVPTGTAHWEVLVRARAIENLTAVVAASQGGDHTAGRKTYGHSMIVDAWGRILARRPEGPGTIVAEIDLDAQRRLRTSFPALAHRHSAKTLGNTNE